MGGKMARWPLVESEAFLTMQMFTHLGNKRSLPKHIGDCVGLEKKGLAKDRELYSQALRGDANAVVADNVKPRRQITSWSPLSIAPSVEAVI